MTVRFTRLRALRSCTKLSLTYAKPYEMYGPAPVCRAGSVAVAKAGA